MKLGSLFSGFGGLDMAVEEVFGARTVWVSDIEPGPRKVLAHRFPDVPNLGDIATVDWSQVEPVDIIAGGSPCTDISTAGRMAGMREGTRSNLWVAMRDAIASLQPKYVIWENVRGALSTPAASAMESDPRLLGDHPNGQPVLRALGRVLGDLADLGYDAEWHGLRAADVGAPHGRFRIFVVAAHPERVARREWRFATAGKATGGRPLGTTPRRDRAPVTLLPTPMVGSSSPAAHGQISGQYRAAMAEALSRTQLLPTPSVADSTGGHERRGGNRSDELLLKGIAKQLAEGHDDHDRPGEVLRGVRHPDGTEAVQRATGGPDPVPEPQDLLAELREHPTEGDPLSPPVASEAASQGRLRTVRDDDEPARSPQGPGLAERRPGEPSDAVRLLPPETPLAGGPGGADGSESPWGPYAAAIHRWEQVLGRPAPSPTKPGRNGSPKLNPAFAEFMMGAPAGWITNTPGVTDTEALRMAGNGVVRQQSAAALRLMLNRMEVAA